MKTHLLTIAAILFASVLFSGCMSFLPHMPLEFENDWKERSVIKPDSMLILIPRIHVYNQAELEKDLPAVKDTFTEWFAQSVRAQFDTVFHIKAITRIIDTADIALDTAELNGALIYAPRYKKAQNPGEPDIVLCFALLNVNNTEITINSINYSFAGNGMQRTAMSTTSKYLFLNGNFSYYNVRTGKRLAYSRFSSNVSYAFHLDAGDWTDLVKETIHSATNYTPLNNTSYYSKH